MKMLTPERLAELLAKAYEAGFREAARWANRDDLPHDIGSMAYKRNETEVVTGLVYVSDREVSIKL